MNILEIPYLIGQAAHSYLSVRRMKRLPRRVVSVGNLTFGGTGKTPATIAIAREAIRRDLMPVILTRGYMGSVKGPCFVSNGDGPMLKALEAGDEPRLMAEKLPHVPVVKGPDRYEDGMLALKHLVKNTDLFILDDGFQHRRLHRDMDVVLLDAADPFGSGHLPPLGRLREPISALRRADVIVLTKADGLSDERIEAVSSKALSFNPDAVIFRSQHRAAACRDMSGGRHPLKILEGRRVFGFCALADPSSFRRTLESAGAYVSGFASFRDHHSYSKGDILKITEEAYCSDAEMILTTEKDMVKIRGLDLPDKLLIIEIDFVADGGLFDAIFRENRP